MDEYKWFREWRNNLKISYTKSLLFAWIRYNFAQVFPFSLKFYMEYGFWMKVWG